MKNPAAAPFHHFVYGWPHSRKLGGGTALMSRLGDGEGEGVTRRKGGGQYARVAGTTRPAAKKPPSSSSTGQSTRRALLPVKDSSTSSSDAISFAGDLLAAAVHVGYHHWTRTPRRTEQRMPCGRT